MWGHAQLLFFSFLLNSIAFAQNGYVPLSREVERNFADRLYWHRTDFHTSIRPYRQREVNALIEKDTLESSALILLDRLATAERKLRIGPLLDLSAGMQPGAAEAFYHRAGAGLWADLDVKGTLNFHIDGQGWSQRFPNYLDRFVRANVIVPGEGRAYGDAPNYTHYDWNAHVSWDPGKYFNITAGRGRNFFGEGYRSLMLSNEAQGYPYLRITTTIWKVKYVNLYAMMDDLRSTDGDPLRSRRKYAAMHYLSWNAIPRLNVSLFEAIVFDPGSEKYPRGFDMHYLNPVIFYRPVEFHTGSPDNALIGISINGKVGRNTMLYSQFVMDEFLMYHVRNGTGWYANKQALQFGAVARNAFNVDGLTLRGEWNYVRPFMYTHINNIQNYAHFGQPLAHPFGSNVHELIAHADLDRGKFLYSIRTSTALMGADSVDSYGNNIFRPDSDRPKRPDGRYYDLGYYHGHHDPITLIHAEVRAGYLLDRNTGTRLEASYLFRSHMDGNGTSIANLFRLGISCYFRDRYAEQEVRYQLQ